MPDAGYGPSQRPTWLRPDGRLDPDRLLDPDVQMAVHNLVRPPSVHLIELRWIG